jgi:solute:Na+ symporter, SSS family
VTALAPEVKPRRDGLSNLLCWICGCVLIYGVLFGVGKLILKETGMGLAMLAVGLLAGAVIYWDLNRRGWTSVVD